MQLQDKQQNIDGDWFGWYCGTSYRSLVAFTLDTHLLVILLTVSYEKQKSSSQRSIALLQQHSLLLSNWNLILSLFINECILIQWSATGLRLLEAETKFLNILMTYIMEFSKSAYGSLIHARGALVPVNLLCSFTLTLFSWAVLQCC